MRKNPLFAACSKKSDALLKLPRLNVDETKAEGGIGFI